MVNLTTAQASQLKLDIKSWAKTLGFHEIGFADIDLSEDGDHLQRWISDNYCGDMQYMYKHGKKRYRPNMLVPDTVCVISTRLDYWPSKAADAMTQLGNPNHAYVSRYALGRDYHKVLRGKLKKLAATIGEKIGDFGYRVFVDSAPVLEKALARNAGLGWIGKNTNLINKNDGSWFFLGELYTDLPLTPDRATENHCGTCKACIDICPTQAFIAPYRLDARKCISYLTIEQRGSIPEEFRKAIGNRIYGCDDCQLICPWNKFAKTTTIPDFEPRHELDGSTLIDLFQWSESEFLQRTEGSAIRRIGYQSWLRNIAIALGNAQSTNAVISALHSRHNHSSAIVREHVNWALGQHNYKT